MTRSNIPLIISLILILLLSGCASVISGTEDSIRINSLEDGVVIKVNNIPRAKNEAELTVSRGKTHIIEATKNGCKSTTVTTKQVFDYRSLLGIFIDFGLITIPLDLASGAAWKTQPTSYTVTPVC